ncbi:IMPACT family protein [Mycobacterium aquaticum]|uniref:IMPACT family protein n=1 Tax=Mycobacterium aquaticum TaxID=1927124 RepID=A0A1X0BAF0_9MYCO|nr:YigZ family protein [Mycobacterium aquaticum]ORA39307.1 IMPACT family protein [Mycobacterium aquaticum]
MSFSLDPEARPYFEETIKKSRFIARLRHCSSEEEASEFLALARELERGAGHHCFAYVLGDEIESRIERYSDDGEPGGTAGAPILAVLKARELVNVVAVVSRYYGGIKLGTGGLTRAYSGTVTSALESTPLQARVRMQVFTLAVDHAEAGWVEAELRRRGFEVDGVHYGQKAVIRVRCAEAATLDSAVAEITSGRGELVHMGHVWGVA